MAIDSHAKRLAVLRLGYVVPDATIDAFDRAAIIRSYYIAPGDATQGTPFASYYVAGGAHASEYLAGSDIAGGYAAGASQASRYVAGSKEAEGFNA